MNQLPKTFAYIGISFFAVFAFLAMPRPLSHTIADVQKQSEKQNYFSSLALQAKAAYVYDITDKKVLYASNEDTVLPLASLTKIMTAITASDLAPESTMVTITSDDLKEEGDSGLYNNERWTLGKLLQYTLVVSSNDGARAVASSIGALAKQEIHTEGERAFVNAMNAKAQSIGLRSLSFANSSGLDESSTRAGAYGSAKDMALLLGYALTRYQNIIEPTRYSSFKVASIDNIMHQADNTDILVEKVPGLIAGKTGYSALAGGNLAVVVDTGIQHPIVVVVLGSTYDGRFSDVDQLIEAAVATITSS